MRVFVTGGSGFIGSAVVNGLLGAGHQVVGLARSEASAGVLARLGADVHLGSLDDPDSLRSGASAAEGVIHLAFNHDFSDAAGAAATDLRAIETIGATLEGSGRPFVAAIGTLGLPAGRVATERDEPDATGGPRVAGGQAALALGARGVRSSVVRLGRSVHGRGDPGFVATLIRIAMDKGVSGHIGDGANRWPTVHRLDAASLFRLALERAPAGSVLHGVAEEGIPLREIAGVIGRHLGLPVVSIAPEDADEHFGFLARFLGTDSPVSSALTRDLVGWEPTHPGLIEDLEQGHYFDRSAG